MTRTFLGRAAMVLVASSTVAAIGHAQRVEMPVGYRLTWIGARWQPPVRVLDRNGRATAAQLTYRIADPTIASVSARGEVTARKPGRTLLWAIAGRDSSSALIMVEPWPAKFAFTPAALRFDAKAVRQPLRVLASDSAGVPIEGGTTRVGACRSVNESVVRLSGGEVIAVGNGSTWIRCSDRGIADSIRVIVQQQATKAEITNKAVLSRRTPGDTFSVLVQARDRTGQLVTDTRPTWAALNPYVVSIDPLTGRARAVGGGETRVIVQVGDGVDSVSISVSGPSAQPILAAVPTDSTPAAKASLAVDPVSAYEGDTSFISLTVLDTAGVPVPLRELTYRILDTTVAQPLDSVRIAARKSGQTQIIVSYGRMVDTASVNVYSRSTIAAGSSASDSEARAAAFRAPFIDDSISQKTALRDSVIRVIHTDPSVQARSQNVVFVGNAIGAFTEHYVRTEAGATEDRTGPLYGGMGTLLLYQKFEVLGSLRMGTLTPVETLGENLNFMEFEGSAGIFPVRQFGLRAGVLMRGAKSDIATQTSMIPKVSLVSRFGFIGDIFNTYAAFSILPKAKVGGVDERGSLFSRGGETGVEFKLPGSTGFNGALTYAVEQISFKDSDRIEGFSAIRLRFGFNVGR